MVPSRNSFRPLETLEGAFFSPKNNFLHLLKFANFRAPPPPPFRVSLEKIYPDKYISLERAATSLLVTIHQQVPNITAGLRINDITNGAAIRDYKIEWDRYSSFDGGESFAPFRDGVISLPRSAIQG